jgi:hypothetical protein
MMSRGVAALRRYARLLALATATLVPLSMTGCGRDLGNPFASFDSRCAKLLPAHFTITQQPLTYTQDDSLGIPMLTRKSGSAFETHRTYGLTVANFGHETSTELRSVEDRRGARVRCTARRRRVVDAAGDSLHRP